jgi:hypothetical protein
MSNSNLPTGSCCCCRRDFLQAMGAAGAMALLAGGAKAAPSEATPRKKGIATVRGAFVYPPSAVLREQGYFSWPGSSFDAEGHQKTYSDGINQIQRELGMQIAMDRTPLDKPESVSRFIADVKGSKPDGLLLIPMKKGHWDQVVQIVEAVKIPAVVFATLGVMPGSHLTMLHRRPGVYLIHSPDDLDAVKRGMKMIETARWMREARIVNIQGSRTTESTVAHLGTEVRTVPHSRFIEEFRRTQAAGPVLELARSYQENAQEIVEPTEADIVDAAKTYFVLKRVMEAEHGDALMMECLGGLRKPHQHVPPCMGFMSLRDEGVPVGCESDLGATLTLMLVQKLFDRPGFQQNPSMDTEKNLYFGAHCTAPSKMNGRGGPAEPYILRSHNEAGWGCVPQVLFPKGQELTIARYNGGETPSMFLYSGNVVRCWPKAPAGCRTNVIATINEVDDVCDVKGLHQIIFYGNHVKELRTYCQLHGIEAIS